MEATGMVLLPGLSWSVAPAALDATVRKGPAPASRPIRRIEGLRRKCSEGPLEVLRQRRGDVDGLARDRVREREPRGVEELAREAELACTAVERVAGDGQPDGGKVDSDLVGSPGLERDAQERMPREGLLDRPSARPWPADDEREVLTGHAT